MLTLVCSWFPTFRSTSQLRTYKKSNTWCANFSARWWVSRLYAQGLIRESFLIGTQLARKIKMGSTFRYAESLDEELSFAVLPGAAAYKRANKCLPQHLGRRFHRLDQITPPVHHWSSLISVWCSKLPTLDLIAFCFLLFNPKLTECPMRHTRSTSPK